MYWITGILGLAFALAPFLFGYSNNSAALWTSLLVGGATAVVSWFEGVQQGREAWEYWTAVTLGVIAIIAPFMFGFGGHMTAMWTSVITGILISFFAVSRLTTKQRRYYQ